MSKRTGVWALSVLMVVVAALVGFFAYNGTTKEFRFTTEQAQTLLNASLEKRALDEKSVTVESAKVAFINDTVVIDATANGEKKGRKLRADVHAVGKPEFRDGSFYFHPSEKPVFSNVTLEKVESKPGPFARTQELLKGRVEQYVTDHNFENLVESFKADFKDWVVGVAEKGVETALTRRPFYTPKNDLKGFVIKAAVEKVEVIGDTLVVTVSLTQILYTIFISILMIAAAVSFLVFLIANPEWGVALAIISSIDM